MQHDWGEDSALNRNTPRIDSLEWTAYTRKETIADPHGFTEDNNYVKIL